MDLIILGSGTSIPLSYRASPSVAVKINGETVLLDLGPGTLRQLTRAGIPHETVRRILITHFHPDHTADFIHFLFVTNNPSIKGKRESFVVTGPVGIKSFINGLQEAYKPWLNLPTDIMKIEEMDPDNTPVKNPTGYTIAARHTVHSFNSIAYRIQDSEGKSLVYSGDTGFCQGIIDLAEGADILILESSFPEGTVEEGHLTPHLAGRIAALAKVNKLVLVHFYPECLATDIAAQCRKSYGGELILGRDLLHIGI